MKRARLDEMVMKKTDEKHNTEPFKVPVKNWDRETLQIYSPVTNIQILDELSHPQYQAEEKPENYPLNATLVIKNICTSRSGEIIHC